MRTPEERHAFVLEDAPRMRERRPNLAVFAPALLLAPEVAAFVGTALETAKRAEVPSDDGVVLYAVVGDRLVRITLEECRW